MEDGPDRKVLVIASVDDSMDRERGSDVLDGDGDGDGVPDSRRSESGKIGVAGAVFLILNKMIGTGSKSSL